MLKINFNSIFFSIFQASAGRVDSSDIDFEHLHKRLQELKLIMSSDSEEDPVPRLQVSKSAPESHNAPRRRPRYLSLPPVSPNDPNGSPYVSLRDFVLAVYHTPLNWKTIFRVKKEEIPTNENHFEWTILLLLTCSKWILTGSILFHSVVWYRHLVFFLKYSDRKTSISLPKQTRKAMSFSSKRSLLHIFLFCRKLSKS